MSDAVVLGKEVIPLLRPGEVGAMFGVDAKTVTRWRKQGKIPGVQTPGDGWMYREDVVLALLRGEE